MEINLLPRKTYIERRFGFLLFMLFLILLALSLFLWGHYLQKEDELQEAQHNVERLKENIKILMANKEWNEGVVLERQKRMAFESYKAEAEQLSRLEWDWSSILTALLQSQPAPFQLLDLHIKDQEMNGVISLFDLNGAATFMERLKQVARIKDVQVNLIDQTEEYKEYVADPDHTYFAQFTARLSDAED